MNCFAILGSHPDLSLAELEAVIKIRVDKSSNQSAIFQYNKDLLHLQNKLGGTQKLGEVLGSVKDHQEIEGHLLAMLLDESHDKKLQFGISVYDLGSVKRTKEIQKYMAKVGISIKKSLKQSGTSARLVISKEPTLSTVVVQKNKLVNDGVEFVLLVGESKIMIGKTRSIQDFEDWSHRDYNRPGRDAKSGMLPPKLARMMVNLAGVDAQSSYLLDPFCGSGTILMEASLLGFDNLIGSDISKKAIDNTRANLKWLVDQNYPVADHTLICSSADFMSDKLENNLIDVIVTEPFLGNPRSGQEQEIEITRGIKSLSELYESSFAELDKLLRTGGKMVMASPVHFLNDNEFPVPTKEIMKRLGYKLISGPFLYKREGQFVGREVLVFQKK